MGKYHAIILINTFKIEKEIINNEEKYKTVITVKSEKTIGNLNIFVLKDNNNNEIVNTISLKQDKEFEITQKMFDLISKNIREKFKVTLSDDNNDIVDLEWIY